MCFLRQIDDGGKQWKKREEWHKAHSQGGKQAAAASSRRSHLPLAYERASEEEGESIFLSASFKFGRRKVFSAADAHTHADSFCHLNGGNEDERALVGTIRWMVAITWHFLLIRETVLFRKSETS